MQLKPTNQMTDAMPPLMNEALVNTAAHFSVKFKIQKLENILQKHLNIQLCSLNIQFLFTHLM